MPSTRSIVLAGITAAVTAATLTLPAQAGTPAPHERARGCTHPSDVLDLSDWKLTLPTGEDEDPTEVTQPDLATFSAQPWFRVEAGCDAVRFRAAVNGVTTGGSSYPRAELREMTDGGEDEAAWSTTDGTHTLVVREAFMALPEERPYLVGAQVHGGDDDVTVFRLEGSSLYITDGDDRHHHLVTDDYELGTEFEAKFVVPQRPAPDDDLPRRRHQLFQGRGLHTGQLRQLRAVRRRQLRRGPRLPHQGHPLLNGGHGRGEGSPSGRGPIGT
jgi:hypothetical protein